MPELFNSIGQKVEKVEKVASATVPNGTADDNDKVVEEIESLCMNCEENVSPADLVRLGEPTSIG